MRQILDIQGLTKHLPFTVNQIYKLTKRQDYPLPYKKVGKKLLFDLERVYRWLDSLPGRDETIEL
jgi:hypothetical protein